MGCWFLLEKKLKSKTERQVQDDLHSRSAILAMMIMSAMKLIPTLEPMIAPASDLQSPKESQRHTVMLT